MAIALFSSHIGTPRRTMGSVATDGGRRASATVGRLMISPAADTEYPSKAVRAITALPWSLTVKRQIG
jgi:hypothetical protein